MDINYLYTALLKRPDTPKVYRDLRSYYQQLGMSNEAEAFALLLKEQFNELDYLPDNHPQQH